MSQEAINSNLVEDHRKFQSNLEDRQLDERQSWSSSKSYQPRHRGMDALPARGIIVANRLKGSMT